MTYELEGMARAAFNRPWYGEQNDWQRWEEDNDEEHKLELMNDVQAALLWLADNVPPSMVKAAVKAGSCAPEFCEPSTVELKTMTKAIRAALRCVAGKP